MGMGYILYRKNMLTDQSTGDLGKVLINLVIPSVVLNQMWTEHTPEKQNALINTFILAVLGLAVALTASRLRFFSQEYAVDRGGSSFSNVGFFGIPMVTAALGSAAVFNVSSAIALSNLLMSTVLAAWLSGKKDTVSLKGVIRHPALITFVAGVLLFFLRVPKPQFCSDVLATITQLNTPIALLLSGAFLAKSDLRSAVTNLRVWRTCLWRLVIIPLCILALFRIAPLGTPEEKKSVWLALSCPIGMNLTVFAKLYDEEHIGLAAEEVCSSTLLCIFTLPVCMMLAEMIL